MAAKAKDKNYKYEDVVDIELELNKRRQFIETALQTADDTWTEYNTKDPNISVVYKKIDDSNIYTIRGRITMDCEPDALDQYYKYSENGYNDVYDKTYENDDKCTEIYIKKLIDDDHQIVYCSNPSGFWIIAARDFTYMRSRFKVDNYTYNNCKYQTIVGVMAYSVNDDHPFNVPIKPDHVRGRVITSGYVLSQTAEQKQNNQMQVAYILAMDPAGMIPQYIVNQFAPKKGMKIKHFEENWKNIKATMQSRKANDFKKDHKALFDQPNEKLAYQGNKGADKTSEEQKEDQ